MCDCAEEQERRRRAEQQSRQGRGSGGAGGSGGSGGGGSGSIAARVFLGSSAFLVGVLALLHKYLDIFGPLLEKYGFRPRKCGDGKKGGSYLDPKDPDPKRCDGLRIDPCKRKWPVTDTKDKK